jgi:hypothetical protein
MIPKSGNRFSDQIMRRLKGRAPGRKTGTHFCWSHAMIPK